jgi:hypothetical protein
MARSTKILCWGEYFSSLRALARDPRCKVSQDGLIYRLGSGLSPEEAATNRSLRDFSHETSDTKFCWHCSQLKALNEFHKSPGLRKGRMCLCKLCNAESHRRWLLTNYKNFNADEYTRNLKQQNGCCACCHNPSETPLQVDHDHKTGTVRGLLCARCNSLLGFAHDEIDRLEDASIYLKRFGS